MENNFAFDAATLATLSFADVARALGCLRLIDTDPTGVCAVPVSEADTIAATVRGRSVDTAPDHVDGVCVVLISSENNPLA